MSRRRRVTKKRVEKDLVYGSASIGKFINKVMKDGKKTTAQKIVYSALEQFAHKIKAESILDAFEQALENAKPSLEVKSRRIGGATYQVPIEIPSDRRTSIAVRWIIKHAQEKVGKSMADGLALELIDCFQNQGATIKKKDDTHRMAEANRAFAHYKW